MRLLLAICTLLFTLLTSCSRCERGTYRRYAASLDRSAQFVDPATRATKRLLANDRLQFQRASCAVCGAPDCDPIKSLPFPGLNLPGLPGALEAYGGSLPADGLGGMTGTPPEPIGKLGFLDVDWPLVNPWDVDRYAPTELHLVDLNGRLYDLVEGFPSDTTDTTAWSAWRATHFAPSLWGKPVAARFDFLPLRDAVELGLDEFFERGPDSPWKRFGADNDPSDGLSARFPTRRMLARFYVVRAYVIDQNPEASRFAFGFVGVPIGKKLE